MKINIGGKEYNFELTGTVGLVFLAQRMLEEEFDYKNNHHLLCLLYCAFTTSNHGVKDLPDLMMFIGGLTTAEYTRMQNYFWQRWNELEGVAPTSEASQDEEEGQGEG